MLASDKFRMTLVAALFLVPTAMGQPEPPATPSTEETAPTKDTTPPEQTTPPEKAEPTEETAPPEDQAAATVNGYPIMQSRVDEVFRAAVTEQTRGTTVPPDRLERLRQQWEPRILENLIAERLLDQELKRTEVTAEDDEFLKEVENALQAYLLRSGQTRQEFEQRFQTDQGKVLAEFIKERAADPEFRQSFLHSKLLVKQYPEQTTVTDADVETRYKRDLQRVYSKPAMVRASHILIKTDQLKTDEEREAARQKMESILAEAKKPDADFAKLATQHSECPSSAKGGDLGFFPRQGAMVEPFAAAAFDLGPGQMSEVVETRFGYHIIKLTERKEPSTISLEQAAPTIRHELKNEKIASVREGHVRKLREDAKIVYGDETEPTPPSSP